MDNYMSISITSTSSRKIWALVGRNFSAQAQLTASNEELSPAKAASPFTSVQELG